MQETWLRSEENVDGFIDNQNFLKFCKSSMKDNYRRGRPYGGVMWMYKKSGLVPTVTFENDRISTFELGEMRRPPSDDDEVFAAAQHQDLARLLLLV